MLSLAVWDLDTSMGGNWTPEEFHPATMSPTRSFNAPNAIFKCFLSRNSIYYKQSIARYNELRQGVLSTDSLISRYNAAFKEIYDCGAVSREQARWSHDTDLAGRELSIDRELRYVTNWIQQRMDFLDTNRFREPLEGDVNGDFVVDIDDINAIINTTLYENGYYSNAAADVNGDKVVDVIDVNFEINLILNNTK